ncbi:medium-chain fatty acid-CoA ligase faa2 [Coemansia interrupta]|uniref:Medium-chain fatty acid-CoA ligase faa2 n=1 Tax=Coemansia interrupta TaxID=1126814 RepID=A0A9W8HDV3_9FUNG|nr:medium-chain fatty acid-CoA ligase faa2 [Coemansia interrupta]
MLKSFKVPSSDIPGYSSIYRHPDYKDGSHQNKYSEITTLYELFKAQLKNHPKANFLGHRTYYPETNSFGKYEWLNTTDVDEMVDDYGSGLDHLFATHAPGMNEETGQQPLGIFSFNRPEWILSELTAFRSSRYSVGISDIAGVETAEFYIRCSELKVLVCSMDKVPRLLERIEHTPNLKVIISMDKLDCSNPTLFTQAFNAETAKKLKSKAASLGIVLTDIAEVIEMGRAKPTEPTLPAPSTYCTLSFSSGSTGQQKGILISHGAFTVASRAAHLGLQQRNVCHLSFMPIAHIYDRYIIYVFMHDIIRIGFASGIDTMLLSDMQALHPTVIALTPRLLKSVYDKVAGATVDNRGVVGMLSRFAYKSKLKRISSGRGFKHTLWDRLIFGKIARLFGGNAGLVISGAISLDPGLQNFFRAALSCNVIQGYGQTESIASGVLQNPNDVSTGNTGIPSPGVDIRLRSIPEMGYDATVSTCPRGELMIRSEGIFSGYFKAPEKTAETMDGEWLASGDITQLNPDGTLTIIDRMKNVIRNSSSINVEVEPLETIYGAHRLVESVVVHGSLRAYDLIAIVVPKQETFVPWAQKIVGNTDIGLAELCKDERVADAMASELRAHGSKTKTSTPVVIGAVHLEPRDFAQIDREFITLSRKIRRFKIIQYYDSVIDGLFKKLERSIDLQIKASGSS